MPKLGTCCNSSQRRHLLLFCFLKHPSRRSVGGKWETQPRFPSGPRPRLFHNQTNPLTLDKTDSRSTTLRSGRDDKGEDRAYIESGCWIEGICHYFGRAADP